MLENTTIYDAHFRARYDYLNVAYGIQTSIDVERFKSQLIGPENSLRNANFKLATWVENCLRRLKAKQPCPIDGCIYTRIVILNGQGGDLGVSPNRAA